MFLFGMYGDLIRNFDILSNAFLSVMSGIRDTVKYVVYDTCSLNYNPKKESVPFCSGFAPRKFSKTFTC